MRGKIGRTSSSSGEGSFENKISLFDSNLSVLALRSDDCEIKHQIRAADATGYMFPLHIRPIRHETNVQSFTPLNRPVYIDVCRCCPADNARACAVAISVAYFGDGVPRDLCNGTNSEVEFRLGVSEMNTEKASNSCIDRDLINQRIRRGRTSFP